MNADRTYWHVPGARAWHAQDNPGMDEVVAACGRVSRRSIVESADRVPPNAHLCGSCARVIAARTDVEA